MPCSNECPSTLALELCETVEEASLRLLAEFRVRGAENPYSSPRSQAQRTDSEAASRCPFASTRRRGSHATRARLPAPPTAALRRAGAAPLILLACGPARTSGGAAPRAGTPRAAHHEPGARAPEGVRMQRLIAVAASAVGRETRRAVNNVASMACGGGQRRRMASRRRARGPHTSVTTQAHQTTTRVAAPQARGGQEGYESGQLKGPAPGAQGPPQAQARPGEAQEGTGSKEKIGL